MRLWQKLLILRVGAFATGLKEIKACDLNETCSQYLWRDDGGCECFLKIFFMNQLSCDQTH